MSTPLIPLGICHLCICEIQKDEKTVMVEGRPTHEVCPPLSRPERLDENEDLLTMPT